MQNPIDVFSDRVQAAQILASRLMTYRHDHDPPLVTGIAREAVPMAKVIANALDGDLDVAIVRKINLLKGANFSFGSATEFGIVLQTSDLQGYEISRICPDLAAQLETVQIKSSREFYTPDRSALPIKNRTVIVVDDGLTEGPELLAVVRAFRLQNPRKIIVASPFLSAQIQLILMKEAELTTTLSIPSGIARIDQLYHELNKITDLDISSIFREKARALEREKQDSIVRNLESMTQKFKL